MNDALRLLLITDAVGGVWVYSLELARALRPLGIETVLAVMGPSPTEQQRQEASDFKLIDTGLPLEWLDTTEEEVEAAAIALSAIAEGEGVDLVQTSSAALLAGADFGCPTVAAQHSCVASWWDAVRGTELPAEFRWRRNLVRRGLQRADAVVAPSQALAEKTASLYGVHVEAIHNGRSAQHFSRVPQGEFVFTAGRLWDEGKNVATLDDAASRLRIPFQAAGAMYGPNGAGIALHHMRGLGNLSAERLSGLFAARPIYASAALYEPFGLSVLEAAQAGCALVLSDISTHRELWGGAALFVPPRDDAAFASAIERLTNEPSERQQLGERARARSQLYSPERMAAGMAGIYAQVLDAQGAHAAIAGAA